jgi:hypothetical protein
MHALYFTSRNFVSIFECGIPATLYETTQISRNSSSKDRYKVSTCEIQRMHCWCMRGKVPVWLLLLEVCVSWSSVLQIGTSIFNTFLDLIFYQISITHYLNCLQWSITKILSVTAYSHTICGCNQGIRIQHILDTENWNIFHELLFTPPCFLLLGKNSSN